MPSIGNQSKMKREIFWLGIIRTLLVQVAVLIALAGAVVWYLNWSSDVAWNEFISASQPQASGLNHHPQSKAPVVQTVKGRAACAWKA